MYKFVMEICNVNVRVYIVDAQYVFIFKYLCEHTNMWMY